MLSKLAVDEFLEILASASPAPGGGSVSALNGSLAAGLVAMVCRLSVNRKDLVERRTKIEDVQGKAIGLMNDLLILIDKDTVAFNAVMAAFKLPHGNAEQKSIRRAAIQEAFEGAVEIPLQVAAHCVAVMELALSASKGFNPNTASDLGVATQCALAGLEGALMNIDINLPSLEDQVYVKQVMAKKASFQRDAKAYLRSIGKMVD